MPRDSRGSHEAWKKQFWLILALFRVPGPGRCSICTYRPFFVGFLIRQPMRKCHMTLSVMLNCINPTPSRHQKPRDSQPKAREIAKRMEKIALEPSCSHSWWPLYSKQKEIPLIYIHICSFKATLATKWPFIICSMARNGWAQKSMFDFTHRRHC